MRVLGWLILAVSALAALAQDDEKDCPVCMTNQFAKCMGSSCDCTLQVAPDVKHPVNCSTYEARDVTNATESLPLVGENTAGYYIVEVAMECQYGQFNGKCWMMQNEMYRLKNNIGTRRKPTEHAMLDNDGIYDPQCESDGSFHPKQCNGTSTCWCVNSAGVRRTDKGDDDKQCPELVETFWFQIQLKHKSMTKEMDEAQLKDTIKKTLVAYQVDPAYIEKIEYLKEDRYILVDLKQNISVKSPSDLATAAYYLEKDVKGNTLFSSTYNRSIQDDGIPFNGEKLSFEQAYVYYIDAKNPEFSMKRMTPGIIAVIVVVCLAVVAGLIVLFVTRRKAAKAHIYQKAEGRELDEIQKQQLTT